MEYQEDQHNSNLQLLQTVHGSLVLVTQLLDWSQGQTDPQTIRTILTTVAVVLESVRNLPQMQDSRETHTEQLPETEAEDRPESEPELTKNQFEELVGYSLGRAMQQAEKPLEPVGPMKLPAWEWEWQPEWGQYVNRADRSRFDVRQYWMKQDVH